MNGVKMPKKKPSSYRDSKFSEAAAISAEAVEQSLAQYPEDLHLLEEIQGSLIQKFMKDEEFSVSDDHHWVGCPLNPEGNFGFIYLIFNILDGRMYVGKKQFWSRTRKKVGDKARRKVVTKELDWRSYTSSSKQLNADIEKYGKDKFVFFSLFQLETRGGLHYAEIECQVLLRVLTARLPNGGPLFYNRQINGCKFLPRECLSEEHRRKISLAGMGVKHSEESKQKMRDAVGPEERKRRSERAKARVFSDEEREKISAALRGRTWTAAERQARLDRMTPRRAARQNGEEFYIGSPCKKCGCTLRAVKTTLCVHWNAHRRDEGKAHLARVECHAGERHANKKAC